MNYLEMTMLCIFKIKINKNYDNYIINNRIII